MRRPRRLACDRTRSSARERTGALGPGERELGEAQDRRHRGFQLVRDDREEPLALTVLGGDSGEPGIECVGENGDFVAPLFEQALVDTELLEPLDFPHEPPDTRSNGPMDLQAKRQGSEEAQQTDDGHPAIRFAAPALNRRGLDFDEGYLHPQ